MNALAPLIHFPTAVWTVLVAISVVYWLFVMSGLVHLGEGGPDVDVDVGGHEVDAPGHDVGDGHDVADGHLPGIATDDVPGGGRDGVEQHQRAEALLERRREQQRIGDHDRERHREPDRAPHHILPIRPCGLNQRKPRNSA